MSAEQYQKIVNSLDKEIADLEKKKAAADKKLAEEQKKAEGISISKNASASIIKSKRREKKRHKDAARKASLKSAGLQEKIADKSSKREDANRKLQKEQQNERRKEQKEQQRNITNIQRAYEKRIAELEAQMLPNITTVTVKENEPLPEYDAFISHAWEDKESFADEFVEELRAHGVKVWYDTNQIKWGDSMRQKIDEGLRKSRFGIVILSPNYIAEGKYWTKAELDALFQLESVNGKTLLPIWHNLTKQQVMNYSPIVANKKAMTTASMTPKEIANEMAKLLSKENIQNGKNENGVD